MLYYLILCLIGCTLWAATYCRTGDRDCRRDMLGTSLLFLSGAFTEPLNIGIYWSPESLFGLNSWSGFDIESFLFNFSFSGVAVALPCIILKKTVAPFTAGHYRRFFPIILPVPILLYAAATFLAPTFAIYNTFLFFLAIIGTILLFRPDLIRALFSGGILFAGLYSLILSMEFLVFPGFFASWNPDAITGIFLFNLPVEEVIFGFLFGAIAATGYKFLFRLQMVDTPSGSGAVMEPDWEKTGT